MNLITYQPYNSADSEWLSRTEGLRYCKESHENEKSFAKSEFHAKTLYLIKNDATTNYRKGINNIKMDLLEVLS